MNGFDDIELTIKQMADFTNQPEDSVRYYRKKFGWKHIGYRGKEKVYPYSCLEQVPTLPHVEVEKRNLQREVKASQETLIDSLTARITQLESSNKALETDLDALKSKIPQLLTVIKKMREWRATVDAKLGL